MELVLETADQKAALLLYESAVRGLRQIMLVFVRKVTEEHGKEVEQEMSMMKKMVERDGVSGRMLLIWRTGWAHRRTKGKGIME